MQNDKSQSFELTLDTDIGLLNESPVVFEPSHLRRLPHTDQKCINHQASHVTGFASIEAFKTSIQQDSGHGNMNAL